MFSLAGKDKERRTNHYFYSNNNRTKHGLLFILLTCILLVSQSISIRAQTYNCTVGQYYVASDELCLVCPPGH